MGGTPFNVVVTGASKGIGFAIAKTALERGHAAVLGARTPIEELPAVQALVASNQGRALYLPGVDVSDAEFTNLFASEAVTFLASLGEGRVTHVVANAGVEVEDAKNNADADGVRRVAEQEKVNVEGTIYTFNAFAGILIAGGGLFASMSSIVAAEDAPMPARHAYKDTKKAASAIAQAMNCGIALQLSIELEIFKGARAFAIAPGAIMTEMVVNADLLGIMLVAAISQSPIIGKPFGSKTAVALLRQQIGNDLIASSEAVKKAIETAEKKDEGLVKRNTVVSMGARLMRDSSVANRVRELLLGNRIALLPEDVGQAVVNQLESDTIPKGGVLKVYGDPSVGPLIKHLSKLLA